MEQRHLGTRGPLVSVIGYGALKIGRNQKVRYEAGYPLPSDDEVSHLLNAALDMGINLIDTAPAYGHSERRVSAAIGHRRDEYYISTKTGETFDGESHFDFTGKATTKSIERSLKNLRTDILDIVFIHSDGRDVEIMQQTDIVETLEKLRDAGKVRMIGLSGKTPEGAIMAMKWADVLMIPYNSADTSHEDAIKQAHERGIGVVLKKALASGQLPPAKSLQFALKNPGVTSAIVGTLSVDHLRADVEAAR